ncbi:MAG: carbohydrate kinase family protein [Candidatus Dormibacteraeota bacterium]|nr:carbohydrate kinase family protein [Candidatus Dormibacteraeota bacterium]MBV9524764.1 carbohydrate kinase family protein [Candidatus Dormibacteraeota bacterium]
MGRIAVTGSVAYDTIMVFPGHFRDHILPERTHLLNVSFQVEQLERRRGGTAANISYTLALLGERPLLCGAVGASDFDEYAAALEAAGVDTSHALRSAETGTATCYITTDLDDNQITAFFSGAMAHARNLDLRDLQDVSDVVVAADDPRGMARHVDECAALGARLTFAPAQQIPSMDDGVLQAGLRAAWLVVGNDYELEMIRERTGLTVSDLSAHATVAVTHGAAGSDLHTEDGVISVPAVPAGRVVDPTGAGDAYIAGLLAGFRREASLEAAGRLAATVASFVVEERGPQGHSFDATRVSERYEAAFGEAPAGLLGHGGAA